MIHPTRSALLIVALMLVATFAATAQAQPALDLFDEATYFLSLQYGGFAQTPPQRLAERERIELVARCEAQGTCPVEFGVEAIEEVIRRLDDPHTAYVSPEAFADVQRLIGAEAPRSAGFGLQATPLETRPGLLVQRVLAGGPAEVAGFQRGDLIAALNGDPLPSGPEAHERLRQLEEEGVPVRVTVERAPDRRFSIEIEPAPHQVRPSLTMLDGAIGLIDIPSFFSIEHVGPAVHGLVRNAQQAGANAMIIDLRNNPGGLLPESLVAAGAFVDEPARSVRSRRDATDWVFRDGTLYVETSQGRTFAQYEVADPARFDGPVAVLIDETTASAAEFLALDLQNSGALVVGEPTFGVADTGTGFIGLSNGGGLQVTTGRIVEPNGKPSPAHVYPDVYVESDHDALLRGEDALLNAAVARLR